MQIACPSCSTTYEIDPASLGAAGRTVRCARCKTTWFADGTVAEPVSAQAETEAFTGVLPPDEVAGPAASDVEVPQHPAGTSEPGATVAPAEAGEPVAIADAPSLVPAAEPPATSDADSDSEVENFAARRKRLQARRKQARRSSRWTALILVLFAFNVALIGARSEVVRFLPQTASLFSAIGLPVNLRNLKFDNMRISKEAQESLAALLIEGTIVSISNKPTEVPRLRFAARDAMGQEIYTWTSMPSRSILGPGEKLEFRSRLVSPPPTATDVIVRFFSPQDAATGAK
ncbi:MAG TPA: MJ0042-type zinc finger domain-containing protein [Pseudolabrys sp.]|nr:MJ0042-type zinc finger domain-containing protein [Pseudolabrys sp.]